jgi:predicted nuclease of predicted toxin-antitoxin system
MPRFLVDEDLPRSLARMLRDAGLDATDVRDTLLRGKSDEEIFAHAVRDSLVILTGDVGFGNILRFPLGAHAGIVVCRFPNESAPVETNQDVLAVLRALPPDRIAGALVIVEPGRVRIRAKT